MNPTASQRLVSQPALCEAGAFPPDQFVFEDMFLKMFLKTHLVQPNINAGA